MMSRYLKFARGLSPLTQEAGADVGLTRAGLQRSSMRQPQDLVGQFNRNKSDLVEREDFSQRLTSLGWC